MPIRITVAALIAFGVIIGFGALLLRASRHEDDARQETQVAELTARLSRLEKSLQSLGKPAADRAGRQGDRPGARAQAEDGDGQETAAPEDAGDEQAAIRAELTAL